MDGQMCVEDQNQSFASVRHHCGGTDCSACGHVIAASENNLHNKRLKLDYEEVTPCLKEVTLVWEKMLATPDRPKVKVDMEMIHAAVAQGKVHFLRRPRVLHADSRWQKLKTLNSFS